MKTAWALLAAFWAWLIWSMPSEMGVIVKASGHAIGQVIEVGWLIVLGVAFVSVAGWLAVVFWKGTK